MTISEGSRKKRTRQKVAQVEQVQEEGEGLRNIYAFGIRIDIAGATHHFC
jgi:hypothetical protein